MTGRPLETSIANDLVVKILQQGGVGVLPTDTIYGIVGSALQPSTVEKIYRLRKRNTKKPMIILISGLPDLKLFGVKPNAYQQKVLKKVWPGKVSVILPCRDRNLAYLHRGTESLAFRLPKNRKLINLLKKTGPLVAPSANWEGKKPASTIKQAKKYFGPNADFYADAGPRKSAVSALINIVHNNMAVLRIAKGQKFAIIFQER